jgi:hypothetical protein
MEGTAEINHSLSTSIIPRSENRPFHVDPKIGLHTLRGDCYTIDLIFNRPMQSVRVSTCILRIDSLQKSWRQTFLKHLKKRTSVTSKAPALIVIKPRVVGSVRRCRLHKPRAAILRPRALTLQSSAAVTHLHTGRCSFYLPRRNGTLSRDCLLRKLNPDLLYICMSEYAS